MKRTDYCGALRERDIGRTVTVMGWAQNKRDMGGVIFIDLRDREGALQLVFDLKNLSREDFHQAEGLKAESVVTVTGLIRERSEETYNPRLVTGTIELAAHSLTVLSKAETLPFSIEDAASVREEVRLRYRFLDLRRPHMLKNLRFRAKVQQTVEEYLNTEGFIAIDTPMLGKSTPEGAREYLVPSRVHPGSFYALPQSPQIFKQLLMVAGVDKYYQIARCFRDEDLRADRQPEFTQVDMELSFVDQEDILTHLEKLFRDVFEKTLGVTFHEPFPRMTWREAMDRYGCDKPDLRFSLPIVDLTDMMAGCSFSVFQTAVANGGVVRAINVKGGGEFTRGTIEALTEKALSCGARGMAWIAIKEDGEPYSILTKYFSEEQFSQLLHRMNAGPGDFILFCADKFSTVCRTLGSLRLDLADMLNLREDAFRFVIITDFPQFEYSEEEGRYLTTHHPFTMPYPEDVEYLLTDPARVRAQAYDFVLNGVELGSGSIRIYQKDVQQKMFEALGFSEEEIEERFGFMVHAFEYGTPPHGGFAFGLDRLVMQMLGCDSIRDVIAFPKNKDAVCMMTEAPALVDAKQLEALGLLNLTFDAVAEKQKARRDKTANIDVKSVMNLSKLTLQKEQEQQLLGGMREMVSFANELAEIDTERVSPAAHIVPLRNVLRQDTASPSFDRGLLLVNAPQQKDGCYFVPQVVE